MHFKPGVKLRYENGFRNHKVAPRYKGFEQTYQIRHQYRQSDNPIRCYDYLNVIFILFFINRVLNFTLKMASGTIK